MVVCIAMWYPYTSIIAVYKTLEFQPYISVRNALSGMGTAFTIPVPSLLNTTYLLCFSIFPFPRHLPPARLGT